MSLDTNHGGRTPSVLNKVMTDHNSLNNDPVGCETCLDFYNLVLSGTYTQGTLRYLFGIESFESPPGSIWSGVDPELFECQSAKTAYNKILERAEKVVSHFTPSSRMVGELCINLWRQLGFSPLNFIQMCYAMDTADVFEKAHPHLGRYIRERARWNGEVIDKTVLMERLDALSQDLS